MEYESILRFDGVLPETEEDFTLFIYQENPAIALSSHLLAYGVELSLLIDGERASSESVVRTTMRESVEDELRVPLDGRFVLQDTIFFFEPQDAEDSGRTMLFDLSFERQEGLDVIPRAIEVRDYAAADESVDYTVNEFTVSLPDFEDGVTEAEAQEVNLLYEAALDRPARGAGLNYWIGQRAEGMELDDLAEAFLDSSEFEEAFGNPVSLSDRDLVEQLYLNVLDREGGETGIDFWTEAIASQTYSRTEMLIDFALSDENRAQSDMVVELDPGYWGFA